MTCHIYKKEIVITGFVSWISIWFIAICFKKSAILHNIKSGISSKNLENLMTHVNGQFSDI